MNVAPESSAPGGGKAVILDDGDPADREALMRALGRAVARLGGACLPGVDTGTTTADLGARGIAYVPDFVANAGGVVPIHALRAGWDGERLRREVLAIGDRVAGILADAEASGTTPLRAAEDLARRRLSAGSAALATPAPRAGTPAAPSAPNATAPSSVTTGVAV